MKHPVEYLRFPEATVETAAEFRQVTGQMLGADAVMCPRILPLILAVRVWTQVSYLFSIFNWFQ